MTIADRLIDAAIAQGPDSPAARLLRELVEAAIEADRAACELDDLPRELLRKGRILTAFPEFGTLSDVVARGWLVA